MRLLKALLLLLLFCGTAHAAPALDGTATFLGSASSSTVTLTTTKSPDIIVVYTYGNAATVSSITSAHLAFTQRATITVSGGHAYEFYAKSSGALTNEVITVNFSTSDYHNIVAFGVNGIDQTAVFDSNGGLPVTSTSAGAVSISTTNNYTFLTSAYIQTSSSVQTSGTGFSLIWGPANAFFIVQYKIVYTPQTSLPIGGNGSTSYSNAIGGMADALLSTSGPPTGVGLMLGTW